jgi:hypothetical protein
MFDFRSIVGVAPLRRLKHLRKETAEHWRPLTSRRGKDKSNKYYMTTKNDAGLTFQGSAHPEPPGQPQEPLFCGHRWINDVLHRLQFEL